MSRIAIRLLTVCLLPFLLFSRGCGQNSKEVERPEKIVSMRQVIYDTKTYARLEGLWKQYYRQYPSEDAYANWVYAARYADDPDYAKLATKGIKKYPGNPTLLYLYATRAGRPGNDKEAIAYLEKAARLDPTYMDPWFSLAVDYLESAPEKADTALKHLLESGAIADEVMDYNYNMLALLDKNAILITNGDNDTYPGWVLERVLNIRPDVIIANKSLLNTDWYLFTLMQQGLPKFITPDSLRSLSDRVRKQYVPGENSYGGVADTLIAQIIEVTKNEHRPVYFAATLQNSPVVDRYKKDGRNLGLVTLVTPSDVSYDQQVQNLVKIWLEQFRTGGLDSWRVHYAPKGAAGRFFVMNYGAALYSLMDTIVKVAPESRLDLFHWYRRHLEPLVPKELVKNVGSMWRSSADVKEIGDWLRSQGYAK